MKTWLQRRSTRLVIGWMAAAGIGMVAVWETLELTQVVFRGRPVYDDVFFVFLLFLVGSGLGLLHGAALAYLGRADAMPSKEVIKNLFRALIGAAPVGLLAFVVASWISLSTVALQTDRGGLWILALLGWLVAALLWGYVDYQSVIALRIAYGRWVGGWAGAAAAVLGFGVLLFLWLARTSGGGAPPEVDVVAGFLVAFLVAVWIGIPAVTVIVLLIGGASRRRRHS